MSKHQQNINGGNADTSRGKWHLLSISLVNLYFPIHCINNLVASIRHKSQTGNIIDNSKNKQGENRAVKKAEVEKIIEMVPTGIN